MKQKAEIIFEVEELVTVKSRRCFVGWCAEYREMVEMMTTEIASALFALNEREVFRLIENEQIHFVVAERIFVCRNSLIRQSETPAVTGKEKIIRGSKQ